jgi:hypothetical protein
MNASRNITAFAIEAVEQVGAGQEEPQPCVDSTFVSLCNGTTDVGMLSVAVLALATIACVLCVLSCLLAVLVHKLSSIWVQSMLTRQAPAVAEACDDPSKGLLHETKSCMRSSEKVEGKNPKKKKASFVNEEGTSCAAARDVDEEDL